MKDSKVLGFKIRHLNSGLYLTSISKGKWSKVGKVWPRRGDAVRAINYGLKHSSGSSRENALEDIPNWELVELCEASSSSCLFMLDKIKYGG
jgi:hypothetical protein